MKSRRPLNVRNLTNYSSDISLRPRFPTDSPIIAKAALVAVSDGVASKPLFGQISSDSSISEDLVEVSGSPL
jgi:hypothetical protein